MENNEYKFTRSHTQIAKGVAITLMMFYHLFAFPDRIQGVSYVSIMPYWLQSIFSSNSIEFFLADFGKICVAMYLFLSGYGLYLSSLSKRNFTIKDSYKKMIKFLINYWTVFLIFVPIGLIFFNSSSQYHFNVIVFMENFFTLSSSYNGEWWFVRLYIELLLVFPLVRLLLKRKIMFSCAIISGLYIISFGMEGIFKILPQLSYLENTLLYHDIKSVLFWQMTFCFGCLTAKLDIFGYINKRILNNRLDTKAFYIAMILLIVLVRIGFTKVFKIIGKADATSVDFVLAPLFILICTNFIFNNKSKKIFLLLGKHSTNMWLTHSFYCYYYFQSFVFIPKLSILIVIWLAVLSLCSSIFIDFVIKSFSVLKEKSIRIKKNKVLT